MWEFCLYYENDQYEDILKLKNHLKRYFKKNKGIVVLIKEKNILLVAVSQTERYFVSVYKYIYNYIINIIYTYYKTNFLTNLKKELFVNEIFEFIIKETLFCFDEDYDKCIISKELNLGNSLNLESFFNFKLFSLKQKWQQLIDLITNNSCVLNSYAINLELSRFLIAELNNRIEDVCLFVDGSKYFIKKINGEDINLSKYNFSKKQNFIGIIKNLINLSPKNIILCGEFNKEEDKLLKEIFIDKLK